MGIMIILRQCRLLSQVLYPRKRYILVMLEILILAVLLVYLNQNILQELMASFNKMYQDGVSGMYHRDTDCEHRLPSAIIIGSTSTGITTFASFLGLHPQTALQFGHLGKEFYSSNDYNKGLGWYRQRMMCSTENQVTVANSEGYFTSWLAPQRIYRTNPNMKFVLLVRDPIVRALSHFLKEQDADSAPTNQQTFETTVFNSTTGSVIPDSPYIQHSKYIIFLKRWLHYFPAKHIHVLNGDALRTNALRSLRRAERFLQIDHIFTDDRLYFNEEKGVYCLKLNSSTSVDTQLPCFSQDEEMKLPKIQEDVYGALQQYFKPYNDALEMITNASV